MTSIISTNALPPKLNDNFFKANDHIIKRELNAKREGDIYSINFDELNEYSIETLVNNLSRYQITLLNSDTIKANIHKIQASLISKLKILLYNIPLEKFSKSQLLELKADYFRMTKVTEIQYIDVKFIDKDFFERFFEDRYDLADYLTFHHFQRLNYEDFKDWRVLNKRLFQMNGYQNPPPDLKYSSSTIPFPIHALPLVPLQMIRHDAVNDSCATENRPLIEEFSLIDTEEENLTNQKNLKDTFNLGGGDQMVSKDLIDDWNLL